MSATKKPDPMTAQVTPRGVRVTHQDGSRAYLREDGIPAARQALLEGNVHPWVGIAVQAWDDHLKKIGGEPW